MAEASTSPSNPGSGLAAPDSRPIVVTVVAVGFLLICIFGGLNAFVVLVNGSTRIDLVESSPGHRVEDLDLEGARAADPRNPQLVALERVFGVAYIAFAISGVAGAVGLLRRRPWSRALLWATAGGAVTAHALYVLCVLQVQTADIRDVYERQEMLELAAATSLINVAVQSIPFAILAGLLRHSALRRYLFDSAA